MKHRGILGVLLRIYKNMSVCESRALCVLFFLVPYFALSLFRRLFTNPSVIFACMTCTLSSMGIAVSVYIVLYIMSKDKGSHTMREVSGPIKEGAEGYFKGQYSSIFRYTLVIGVCICLVYLLKGSDTTAGTSQGLSKNAVAMLTGLSFVVGASLSALTGYMGIWVSVRANVR